MRRSRIASPALDRYETELAGLSEEEGTILNCADAEGRDLSPADVARLDQIEARRDKLTGDLNRHARALEVKAELAERKAFVAARSNAGRITGGELAVARSRTAGFRNLVDFTRAIRAQYDSGAPKDERFEAYAAATTTANEGAGPAGGWAVPPGLAAPIVEAVAGPGSLLGMMRPVPVDRTTAIPVDTGTAWGTTGIQAAPTAEGASTTATVPALALATPTLYKATALANVTEELIADSPRAAEALAGIVGRQLRGAAERWILRGTGAGEPLGILSSPALISVPGTGAGTLTASHVAAAAGRLLPGDPGAFIVAGPGATGALTAIELGGGRLPLPVVTSMEAPAVGTAGDATLVAPSGFAVHVHSSSFTQQMTIYFAFDQHVATLRAYVRLGMAPLLSAPVTPKLDSSTTVSHAVTTATRT